MPLVDASQLKLKLDTSGLRKSNNPLYEVIRQLIDATHGVSSAVTSITGSTTTPNIPTGLPQSFITENLEQATLPNSKQLVAGPNITITDLAPAPKVQISASGGATTLLEQNTIFSPGIDGDDGEQGPPGQIGLTGATGAQGPQGPTGPAGPLGSPAPLIILPGWDGDDGDMGPPGLVGATGATGATGAAGTVPSGAGEPQGVVSASVGSGYLDTNTGYLWLKMGGGSTAYGWYVLPFPGAGNSGGKIYSSWTPNQGAASTGPFLGIGTGFFNSSQGSAMFTNNNPTTQSLTILNGKTYATDTSGTTSGTNMFVTTNTTNLLEFLADEFDLTVEFLTAADITNLRFWCGLSQAVITDTDTVGLATNALMFRYSTPASDGGWVGYSAQGGSSSVTGTVNAIAASTLYKLRIRFIRAGTPTAYFSVNDGTEVSKTTNLPVAGATLFFQCGLTTKANVAKTFSIRAVGATWG